YISSKFVEETIKCHRNGSSRTESRESARILRRFSAGVRFASLGDASNRASKGCLYFGNSDEGDDDDGVHDFEAETLYGTNAQLIKSLFAKTP
ncbi:hypothetical protein, partial [Pseudomonas aeruginosa]|uniref:hypothetical protein n=1 Tax=Pseudomonas aeruginosa TaxID=287 RepID=UPI001968AAC1